MAKRHIDIRSINKVVYSGSYGGKELVITYVESDRQKVFSKENWIKAYKEALTDDYDFVTINWLGREQITSTVQGFMLDKLV